MKDDWEKEKCLRDIKARKAIQEWQEINGQVISDDSDVSIISCHDLVAIDSNDDDDASPPPTTITQ